MDIRLQIPMEASADRAWTELGLGFGNICDWSSAIQTSSLDGALGVGASRTCRSAGFGPFPPGVVTEQLTEFDDEARRFTYVATTGLPRFLVHAQNTWSIVERGPERCTVELHAVVHPAWWARPFVPLLPVLLRLPMARLSNEMKARVEGAASQTRAIAG